MLLLEISLRSAANSHTTHTMQWERESKDFILRMEEVNYRFEEKKLRQNIKDLANSMLLKSVGFER